MNYSQLRKSLDNTNWHLKNGGQISKQRFSYLENMVANAARELENEDYKQVITDRFDLTISYYLRSLAK